MFYSYRLFLIGSATVSRLFLGLFDALFASPIHKRMHIHKKAPAFWSL